MHRHLVLRLEAPMVAFGGEAIDNLGVIRPFPAKSMIVGLLANALGIERYEYGTLQALQDHLTLGSRIQRNRRQFRDFQTVQLSRSDQGWTTRQEVEGRGGSTASYAGPHIRHRDYWADAAVAVVFRMRPGTPFTLEALEAALQSPSRPLFIGRKTCIPSSPVFNGDVHASTVLGALIALMDVGRAEADLSLQWPAFEDAEKGETAMQFSGDRIEPICDERNWITGVHAGERLVRVLDFNEALWDRP